MCATRETVLESLSCNGLSGSSGLHNITGDSGGKDHAIGLSSLTCLSPFKKTRQSWYLFHTVFHSAKKLWVQMYHLEKWLWEKWKSSIQDYLSKSLIVTDIKYIHEVIFKYQKYFKKVRKYIALYTRIYMYFYLSLSLCVYHTYNMEPIFNIFSTD